MAYHISLVKVQTNYCNNNLFILDVKQLNEVMKLYHFYTLKALWEGQGKIKMYYDMPRVKKQLSRKKIIAASPFSFFTKMLKPLQFFLFIAPSWMSQSLPKNVPYWRQQTDDIETSFLSIFFKILFYIIVFPILSIGKRIDM